MNVRFFAGTKEQYIALGKPHNSKALYFCEDTQELYWGDLCLSDGIRVVPTYKDLPELSKAADGIVYYITETRNGYTLSPDRTEWIQTIYAPATDAYIVPEKDIYNTVTTVGAVRDIEKKIYAKIEETVNNGVKAISFAGYRLIEVDGVFVIDKACAREALGVPTKVSELENDAGYLTEYQDISVKADNVPFTADKYVKNAIGSFAVGDNVKDLTIAEILTRVLDLVDEHFDPEIPEDPKGIVETIMANRQPMYQINDQDIMTEIPFNLVNYKESEAATINDNKSCFYIVYNIESTRVEAGYQHFSTPKEPYYIIALPEELEVTEAGNVVLQTWDIDNKKWVDALYVLTADYDEIVATYDADGITPPVAPSGYRLWADLGTNDPGTSYRFIIKE